MRVAIQREPSADPAVPLPSYATAHAAGADIRANFPEELRAEGVTLSPSERVLIPTGFRMEIPAGFEAQIRPRSGLALKHGLALPNSPGTIDADYRGPVGVILINLGQEPFTVLHGERIAQMVLAPVTRAEFLEAPELSDTDRGASGFGSTGRK